MSRRPWTASAQRRGVRDWPAVALVGAAFAITMLGTTLPTPLYPIYAARLRASASWSPPSCSRCTRSASSRGCCCSGTGRISSGRRPLLLAGLALSGLSAVAFLLPSALAWLFVGRVLSGLSAGIFTGTATATIVDLAPRRGRGRAGLIAAAVNMGGLGPGPVLAGVLAQYAPLPTRLCFIVDLALVAAVGLLRARGARAGADARDDRPAAASAAAGTARAPPDVRPRGDRRLRGLRGSGPVHRGVAGLPRHRAAPHQPGSRRARRRCVVFAASVAGQTLSDAARRRRARCGSAAPRSSPAWPCSRSSLAAHSLALLVVGGVVAGLGQGLSFRAGLGSVTVAPRPRTRAARSPPRSSWCSTSASPIPVIGMGAMAVASSLVTAGVVFASLVAALAAVALVLLMRAT